MGTVANLVVRISGDPSGLEKSFKRVERAYAKTGDSLVLAGKRVTAAVTLPLVGAAVVSTKFAADFDKSMTKLVTLSGQSEKSMQQMRRAVLGLAPTVAIGPRALAEGLLVVTSTGFEGAAALQVLELAAKASAIGMGETKDVARALTAAVSAYGSENLSASRAADILHATVVAGGAEANELAGELGRVVGIASQLGVGFEEVGAFIATYTRLGLSASEATTGLSGALNTILSPSQQAREALAAIGLSADSLRMSVAEDGLGAALTTLLGKLNGNADATAAVFGNVRALAGVMGTAGTQGEQYAQVLEQIRGSSGNLNAAFEETKRTFAFRWEQFKAQAERAAIVLGTQLLPAATRLLDAAKPLGEWVVSAIDWFSQLPQPVQTVGLALMGVAAAAGPVMIGLGSIIKAGAGIAAAFTTTTASGSLLATTWSALTGIASAVGYAVSALVAMFGGWTIVIGAAIAAIVALGVKTGALQSILGAVWSVAKGVGGVLLDIGKIVGGVTISAVSTLWGWVEKLATALGSGFVSIVSGAASVIASLIPNVVKDAISWAVTKIEQLREILSLVADLTWRRNGAAAAPKAPSMFGGATPWTTGQDGRIKFLDDAGNPLGAGLNTAGFNVPRPGTTTPTTPTRANQFSGSDVFTSARQMMDDLKGIGGLTKLTADETRQLNRTLTEALDKYAALGRVAPQAMFDTWVATLDVQAVTGLPGEMPGTPAQLPSATGFIHIPTASPVRGSALPGASFDVGANGSNLLPKLPGFLAQAFGTAKQFGSDLGDAVLGGMQSGWQGIVSSVGSFIGGKAMKLLGANLGKSIGGALGGLVSSVAGPLGAMLGGLAGKLMDKFVGLFKDREHEKVNDLRDDFLSQFGGTGTGAGSGFGELANQLHALGDAGDQLFQRLIKATRVEEFEAASAAIEQAFKDRIEGVTKILDGVNARAQVFGQTLTAAFDARPEGQTIDQFRAQNQDEFGRVGTMAVAGFGLAMTQDGAGAMSALAAIKPTLDVLIPAQQQFNFEASETVARLMEIAGVVEANSAQFAAIEANGQILRGMIQGNLADFELFKAVSTDITSQIDAIVAKGVPMAQALALSQPQLQSLWEAQQKFGFETDEATAALLRQAEEQGIVGAGMKDVNQKILDVLLAIGDALGAKIPDALRGLPAVAAESAGGMKEAFDALKIDVPVRFKTEGSVPDGVTFKDMDTPDVEFDTPQMASGGIVRARPGGTVVTVGEGGRDEAIVPLGGGGMTRPVNLILDDQVIGSVLLPIIANEAQRLGLA